MVNVPRRSRFRRIAAVLVAAATGVVLVAAPASAHPNVVAAGPLHAGVAVRLDIFIIGDEGSVTGMDLTFPSSFAVKDALPAQGSVGTLTTTAHTITMRAAAIPFGTSAEFLVDGVPSSSTPFRVGFVGHFSDRGPFTYPSILVATDGRDPSAATAKGPLGGTAGKIGIGLGVAAVAAVLAGLRMRSRRERHRAAAP